MVRSFFVLGVAATACVIGCAATPSSGSTTTVSGVVSPSARRLDNARAVAMTASGKTYWAYLDARGAFSLSLPAGQAYRIVVANARPSGGQRVVGHVVIHTSRGASRWIAPRSAGALTLGALGGAAGVVTRAMDDGSPSDGSSGDDHDFESRDDDDERGNLCTEHDGEHDDDDVELDAESDPGDSARDDDEDEHEREDDDGDAKTCAPAALPPPPSPAPPGGTCSVSTQCAPGLSCIASKCAPTIR